MREHRFKRLAEGFKALGAFALLHRADHRLPALPGERFCVLRRDARIRDHENTAIKMNFQAITKRPLYPLTP